MDDCPNPECRKIVDGHNLTLYGEDGRDGLVGGEKEMKTCLTKKVSRKGAITVTIAIATLLFGAGGTFGVYGLETLKKDRGAIANNEKKIIEISVELKAIKEAVQENQDSLVDIKEQIDKNLIDPTVLKALIKDAVTEGNRSP